MAFRRGIYIVPTHRWYIERTVWLIAGGALLASTTLAALVHPLWILLTIASVLSIVHSPWWLTFTGFVGVAMVWFAATGYCIMANGLYWLGAEPRLAPLSHEKQSAGEAPA